MHNFDIFKAILALKENILNNLMLLFIYYYFILFFKSQVKLIISFLFSCWYFKFY